MAKTSTTRARKRKPAAELGPKKSRSTATATAATGIGESAVKTLKAPPASKVVIFESGRAKICGHPSTAIARWMGKDGWDKNAAMAAFAAMEVTINMRTIMIQLNCGRTGDRGGAPELTAADVRFLKSMRCAGEKAAAKRGEA